MAKRKFNAPTCKCGKTFAHGPNGDYCTRCDATPEIANNKTYLTFCRLKSHEVPNRKDTILNDRPGVWVTTKTSVAVEYRILRQLDEELFFTNGEEFYGHPNGLKASQIFAVSIEEHYHRLDMVLARVLARDPVRHRVVGTIKEYLREYRTGYMMIPDIADITEVPEE